MRGVGLTLSCLGVLGSLAENESSVRCDQCWATVVGSSCLNLDDVESLPDTLCMFPLMGDIPLAPVAFCYEEVGKVLFTNCNSPLFAAYLT